MARRFYNLTLGSLKLQVLSGHKVSTEKPTQVNASGIDAAGSGPPGPTEPASHAEASPSTHAHQWLAGVYNPAYVGTPNKRTEKAAEALENFNRIF